MKIKQNHITSPLNYSQIQLIPNTASANKSSQNPNMIKSFLPNHQLLYNQLVQQLGIGNKQQRIKFKQYFLQKYRKHMCLLQGHNIMQQRFLISKQSIDINRQKQIKKMREFMHDKQNIVQQRKQKNNEQIRKKVNIQQQKWKQIIDKNKKQYLKNIKNSMKLIKRWENKLLQSKIKKEQKLNQIVANAQYHNQYVNNVNFHSRILQHKLAQENIMKLENSLSMRSKTQKLQHRSNKKFIFVAQQNSQQKISKPTYPLSANKSKNPKTHYHKKYTLTSQNQTIFNQNNQLSKNLNTIKQRNQSPHSQISRSSNKTQRLHKQNSQINLKRKTQLDEQQVQYLLIKNVKKEKKIMQARNAKNYLHQQRIKQIARRQQQIRYKMLQNIHRLKQEQENRNNNLDIKFSTDRKKNKYNSVLPIPKKISHRQKYNNINISLPDIKNKQKYNNSLPIIKQSQFTTQLRKKNNNSNNKNKQKNNRRIISSYIHPIYLTNNPQIIQNQYHINNYKISKNIQKQQNNYKYNKHILDKLRSVSLIAHFKYKRSQQFNNKNKNNLQY